MSFFHNGIQNRFADLPAEEQSASKLSQFNFSNKFKLAESTAGASTSPNPLCDIISQHSISLSLGINSRHGVHAFALTFQGISLSAQVHPGLDLPNASRKADLQMFGLKASALRSELFLWMKHSPVTSHNMS